MTQRSLPPTNFVHLQEYDEQLPRLGLLAEKYFPDDPNTCLLKLRQLAELLAQQVASRVGVFVAAQEAQFDLLRRLQDHGILPREVAQLFDEIRRAGNAASHALTSDHRTALSSLKIAWLLKRDEEKAHQQLAAEPLQYDFALRHYQQAAIRAIEAGIEAGRRDMLVAMATGTGKTKTCIALIYRLLKAQRFRRVLFLVDRSALGEQATNAFKDTRMENLQTFADIFGIKELEDQQPDTETAVHIATVQGMVKRVLYPGEDETPPSVDQYDCIIVDECHRGYLLDRELSETELTFRGFDDYISTGACSTILTP